MDGSWVPSIPPISTAEFPVPPLVVRHAIRLPQTTVVTVFFSAKRTSPTTTGDPTARRQGGWKGRIWLTRSNKVRMMNRTEVFWYTESRCFFPFEKKSREFNVASILIPYLNDFLTQKCCPNLWIRKLIVNQKPLPFKPFTLNVCAKRTKPGRKFLP